MVVYIQSARLCIQSSELGPPCNPSPARECCPPPLGPLGETYSLARERGGRTQFRQWYSPSGTSSTLPQVNVGKNRPPSCTNSLHAVDWDVYSYKVSSNHSGEVKKVCSVEKGKHRRVGGNTRLWVRGWGEPNSDEGTESLALWAGIFKPLWSPGIDAKASIPPAYVAWRAGTITLFLLGA